MNLYDFDETIYKYDSPSRFYFFCLGRHPKIWWHLFKSGFWGACNALKIIDLKHFKEKFFSFIPHLPNLELELEAFWEKEIKNINAWYYEKKKDDDVICSATPRFMMEYIVNKINPTATLVCSEIDYKTAKFKKNEQNCKGEEKSKKLKKLGLTFEEGYGDSLSDVPMLKLCKKRFRVINGGEIIEFDKKYFA